MGEIRIFGLGVLVFMSYLAFIQCDETTKSKENSVLVHFMDQKRSEFLPIVPTIKEAIANAFNEYCRNESANCENFKNIKITPKNVKFFGSNDREKFHEETRFVISNIYIDNEDSDQEADILSKQIASDFFKNSRDEIVKNSKVQIAYIDNQLVFPARDNLDNWLIVSISCAFCVALIILNLVCQMRISKAELKPKNKIYKKQSDSSEQISRGNDIDNQFPLLKKHDESYDDQNGSGYLEPIQQFPIPSTPITATNRHLSNIRTNPHMRLTQV